MPQLRGGTTPLAIHIYIHILVILPSPFSLCQLIWIARICMSYLSYPVRWYVIALSTLLTAFQCSISVMVLFVIIYLLSLWEQESAVILGVLDVDRKVERLNGKKTHTLRLSSTEKEHAHRLRYTWYIKVGNQTPWLCWMSTGRKNGLM